MSPPLICLDAGHGGGDPGALATLDGEVLAEKDWALVQAMVCESFIRAEGFRTEMTRRVDKRLPNWERAQLANRMRAAAFVSIHWNSAPAVPEANGTIVMCHANSARGRQLAEITLAAVGPLDLEEERWERVWAVPDGVEGSRWQMSAPSVLSRTRMPAVLIEAEFASSEADLRRLLSTPHQIAVGKAVARAVAEWWTEAET